MHLSLIEETIALQMEETLFRLKAAPYEAFGINYDGIQY